MLLLHFVVEFVQELRAQRVREQVAERPVRVVHKQVAVEVPEHIEPVVPWVLPLSSLPVLH